MEDLYCQRLRKKSRRIIKDPQSPQPQTGGFLVSTSAFPVDPSLPLSHLSSNVTPLTPSSTTHHHSLW
ncbi:hypothetical protein CesoFtcFv8_012296 [Champsocephalus esox]|uniref:Uncharacterized protein n=1 Tax=Champsocephalus esox TaxID=159716 RepID=A0AAN8GUI4_9TELE|nr:hypothetical protein CesoFtcFv8_012296 [Champsocephalus esox]